MPKCGMVPSDRIGGCLYRRNNPTHRSSAASLRQVLVQDTPAISVPINGESWFAVETIDNLPWFMTNHAQPEPKRVAAAFSNSALKFSTEPKSR